MRFLLATCAVLSIMGLAKGQGTRDAARFAEVHRLDSLGKHDRALKILAELAADPAQRQEALLLTARCEFEHLQKVEEAFGHVNTAIASAPKDHWPLTERANMYAALRMTDRAMDDLNAALALTTDTAALTLIHVNRGVLYKATRQNERALEEFDLALQLDSTDIAATVDRASTLDELGRRDEALAIMQRLSAKEPENIVYLNNIGFMLLNMERYAEAADMFSKGLALVPDDAFLLNNRGYARLKAGDAKAALKDVKRSLELNGSNSYAHRNLGLVQQALGHANEACTAFERAMELGYTEQYGDDVKTMHAEYCR